LESLVQDVFRLDPEFESLLASGAVGRPFKEDVLRKVFANRASELFFNFLLALNHHERLDLIRPILAAYRELRDQRAHRIRVLVRSAVPLPEDQRERLRQDLRQTFQLEPNLELQVDPELLGGLTVRVGDWLYDASVRTQLKTIRDQLLEKGSHAIQSGRDRFIAAGGD
jgi:F-type H+-transporting ATPase subunit delta